MNGALNLDASDEGLRATVEAADAARRYPESVGELVARWIQFTQSVEAGYDQTVYDYTNEIGVRRVLAGLSDVATARNREVTLGLLLPL